jgi:hypothetical protein
MTTAPPQNAPGLPLSKAGPATKQQARSEAGDFALIARPGKREASESAAEYRRTGYHAGFKTRTKTVRVLSHNGEFDGAAAVGAGRPSLPRACAFFSPDRPVFRFADRSDRFPQLGDQAQSKVHFALRAVGMFRKTFRVVRDPVQSIAGPSWIRSREVPKDSANELRAARGLRVNARSQRTTVFDPVRSIKESLMIRSQSGSRSWLTQVVCTARIVRKLKERCARRAGAIERSNGRPFQEAHV